MLTRMDVASYLPGAPALPLGGFVPNNEAVQIRGITGIEPVKSSISSTPYATGRGELFQGPSTGSRNIVLSLGLNPSWFGQTMADLRQLLYRYFMPENWVTLRFFSNNFPEVYINGIVESFDPNIFSQDPEIQISIICPSPDFIAADPVSINGPTGPSNISHLYNGTVDTGFELKIEVGSAGSYNGDVEIHNQVGPFSQVMVVHGVAIDSTHTFLMHSYYDGRFVRSLSAGTWKNILSGLDRNSSTWPVLKPGENTLRIVTTTAGLLYTLSYNTRYGGL